MPRLGPFARRSSARASPWDDPAPVRHELFGPDRLEQHAESLAAAQTVAREAARVPTLRARLEDDAVALRAAYLANATGAARGGVVPAAEWLLDNDHVIVAQIDEVRADLPPGYYRQLPKLAAGPLAGYPRVLGLVWAYVAHTDSRLDVDHLQRFVAAYQRVQPLTIGELWAIAITLRFVLIENVRRVADQIDVDRSASAAADVLAERIRTQGGRRAWRASDLAAGRDEAWTSAFATQLATRLRDQDPLTTPALGWLEDALQERGTSIAAVVEATQQRLGAANVTVRNAVTSMRRITDIDWADLFESVSLVDARLREGSAFDAMDFSTRDRYRAAVETLARASGTAELDVVARALEVARAAAAEAPDEVESARVGDPGHHLIGAGRRAFERHLHAPATLRTRVARLVQYGGLGGYVGTIVGVTALLVALFAVAATAAGLSATWSAVLAALLVVPLSETATALVHRALHGLVPSHTLPGLGLASGVPSTLRTLVVVPTVFASERDVAASVERLEVHHLSGAPGDLTFALLSDLPDADTEVVEGDAGVIRAAQEAIDRLNDLHGPGPSGPRFLLLHRRRVHVSGEGVWMGWERKRGKLHELCRLLRGAGDTTFMHIDGREPFVPDGVRYVITLDADTQLPRESAVQLIGKMAHPLNRPRIDPTLGRVVEGHAVLQPRLSATLPMPGESTVYQSVFGVAGGIDPYASAASDVYQDLFGEGSYTGKGIFDVDAFEAALAGRVPERTLLSHDLFEGIFARAGLASDVELVETSPARYDVAVKRQQRWVRGDWQLLPWVIGRARGAAATPPLGRWKMADNLRRSLVAPAAWSAIVVSWFLPWPVSGVGIAAVVVGALVPTFIGVMDAVMPRRTGVRARNHLGTLARAALRAATQTLLGLVFLADTARWTVDAIGRTITRVFVTRRHLLEWVTAARAETQPVPGIAGSYRRMAVGVGVSGVLAVGALTLRPEAWPIVAPFALAWIAAPAVATWVSRSLGAVRVAAPTPADADALRLVARRTWRYFETFVTATERHLPPDNVQDDPKTVIAQRTSPTNIGLYLLAAVSARDLGWAGSVETVERLEATLASVQRLERFRGHLYNWYRTVDAQVLHPQYVSTVDSGNLAGHLIALANACETWDEAPLPDPSRGALDALALVRETLATHPGDGTAEALQLAVVLDGVEPGLRGPLPRADADGALGARLDEAARLVERVAAAHPTSPVSDELRGWFGALRRALREHGRDAGLDEADRGALDERLRSLAATARALAYGMDFGFLIDEERALLSIGYDVSEHRLDESCYDLLASEARLASLFAIAKGDVETRHWFRLGRTARPVGTGSVLWSWTGSMFEYLMPALVMHAPAGSLLEQSQRRAVDRQRAYGRTLDVPWGISESAYAARDLEFTYQYAPFGVPDLGLKRATLESLVVAPYATGLATMVEPGRARRNFERLREMGALGPYGFYDALDFTRSRAADDARFTVVRTSMAHHQGMTIVGIANALDGGRMRTRFHREPAIRAAELLLQERVPRDVIALRPTEPDIAGAPFEAPAAASVVRTITPSADAVSATHLLSNGRYAVMLTSTGAGYSRWGDVAITRWRPDATRDDLGTLVFVRDTADGAAWPVGRMPLNASGERSSVAFAEDRATFKQRFGRLETTMDVLVSAEDDAEVRRVSLANTGRTAREIELTSYAELALTAPATDDAHPAFAKMFVQTEYLSEHHALIATRRRRSPHDDEVWAAHLAVVEGDLVAEPSYETDRARFIGRTGSTAAAAAMAQGGTLSGTVGTVLDPIFALRRRVRVPAGAVVRVAFWTLVAPTRAALLDLIDQHDDRSAFDRAKTLAWTQAQLQLRYLDVDSDDAADFQRLATPLLYPDARFRAPPGVLSHGAGTQAGLWPHAISGDLPIVLLRIDDVADLAQVRQLLSAHEYWRLKRLAVDIVIVNEHGSSYLQDLQSAIEAAVRSSQARPRSGERLAQGSVYTLRADLLSPEAYALLRSVARVALIAQRGPFRDQLARMTVTPIRAVAAPGAPRIAAPLAALALPAPAPDLENGVAPVRGPALADVAPLFANGTGGFSADGREYVTVLQDGATTPLPWINVIANQRFGFHVSAEGSGYTWSQNSRDFQLTPWSNDPVVDPPGELIYVRDEATGAVWNATAQGVRDDGTYVARHGFGYSRFEHEAHDVALDLVQFVPLGDPIKVSRLTLHNRSSVTKRLSVTAYGEWVLGTSRDASAPYLVTAHDESTGSMFVRNPWNGAYAGVVAFSALGAPAHAWTGDRTEFLGRGGRPSRPKALFASAPMSRRVGAGLDPCTALQTFVELAPGASVEVVSFVGAASSQEEARSLVTRYRVADLDAALADVQAHWRSVLGAITVRTPDPAMDVMLNGWLLYQTIACRLWARSAFYQASGAYGFRDQLQDGMALTFAMPDEARAHLLRAASRQFVEGDVQHWWLPSSGRGVRTRISDDRVWLAYAAATYVERSADTGVLDEVVPFLEGPDLRPGEHDAFFEPREAFESGTLFEHCARGLDQAVALTGAHGLPLMGTGDWNDGMNRVGEGGQGESVWLGWLLVDTIERFSDLTSERDPARVARWRAHAAQVRAAIEREAWDGAWYRRATFDDGTWLGTASGEACRIDSIAQTWAVLSGAAEPARAATAMASFAEHLLRPSDGLALLFTPPFDDGPLDPGYIKGYPPGLRENGGQYTHAAMWAILAYVRLGKGDEAVALFDLLNPINHARSPADAQRYAVEPYVVAADVYSVAPHVGRGGWTWYTGSAAWMYRAGVEGILGIRREAGDLVVDPCLPAAWPGFEATVRSGDAVVTIAVDNAGGAQRGRWAATLDGVSLEPVGGVVRARFETGTHRLRLWRHSDYRG